MIIPINKIPAQICQTWMNDTLPPKMLDGHIVYIETWNYFPTFCFMTMDGETYHDVPMRAFNVKCYHERKDGVWDCVESSMITKVDRAKLFEPPNGKALQFVDRTTPEKTVTVVCGLIWQFSDVLLYLCYNTDGITLWPPHKLRFGESAFRHALPDWRRNRHQP